MSLHLGPRRGFRRATSAVEHYERGCELQGSDPDLAIAAFRRAIAGRPDLADAHNNLGRLLHDRGELAAAEQCYRNALEHDDLALYWFNLGVVLEDLGRDPIGAYEQAIAKDARCADAHFNLARQIERVARQSGDELMLRRAVRHLARYRDLIRVA